MKNFLKLSLTALATLSFLFVNNIYAAQSNNPITPILSVSSQTSDSVILNASGLTVGTSYKVNLGRTSAPTGNVGSQTITASSATQSVTFSTLTVDAAYVAGLYDANDVSLAPPVPFTIVASTVGVGATWWFKDSDGNVSGPYPVKTDCDVQRNSDISSGHTPTSECIYSSDSSTPNFTAGWYYELTDASGARIVGPNSSTGCQADLATEQAISGVTITMQCYEVTASAIANIPIINPNLPVNPALFSGPSGLIPCGTVRNTDGSVANPCGFSDLATLVSNVMFFILIVLAVPIAAIMFAYAGFLMLTSGGSTERASKAKSIFINVALGLVFVAGAWLIVDTILSILGYTGTWTHF